MTKLGTIRITSGREYNCDGFVVEQFTYCGLSEPTWCIPGWVEDQWGEDGHFDTREAAEDFLEMVRN